MFDYFMLQFTWLNKIEPSLPYFEYFFVLD